MNDRNFGFYNNAALKAECKGNNARSTLLRSRHVRRKDQAAAEGAPAENNILVSTKALHDIFSASKVEQVLRCYCDICRAGTEATTQEMDRATASAIASHHGHLKLFVTLSLMGGTFAMRELYKDSLHTVADALEKMQHREDLRTILFTRFLAYDHIQGQLDPLKYLESVFRSSLQSKAWILEVPTFRMNDDTRQFREPQNFPFVKEQPLGHRTAAQDRAFFRFRIHDDFCDSSLKGQDLFRKQLSLAGHQHDARERSENEKNILEFLKDLRHPNIAEILFAYEETYEQQYNLVFRFYPCDLDKILYNLSDASRVNITAQGGTPQQFLGSVLDHWLWKGLLGVIDAIANLHDPQNQHVPATGNGTIVGGHFDIKPANILIDYDSTLKLTDFGQAYLKPLAAGEEANMTAVPGTYNYSPPRASVRKLTRAYDIWSLACVLIEVLNFVIEKDDDATAKFFQERQDEDLLHFAKFWRMDDEITQSSTRSETVLKSCVTERLSKWKTREDQYLTRVIQQIERMLPTIGTPSATAKACLQVFYASVALDRYMFKSNDDTFLGGPKSSKPFQRMRTTFTTERILNPLEFDLCVWRNQPKDEITISMEIQGNDGYKFLVPNSTKITLERFIPTGLFDLDRFIGNTSQANPSLQFCFQNLHKAVRFYVPRRKDLYHLQGALTYQLPVEGSDVGFQNCTFTTNGLRGKPSEQGAGHIQVWKELTESKHQERYEDESYASDRSSSNSDRAIGALRLTDVLRLALYIRASGSGPARILVMTLTENTNNLYFNNSDVKPMMFIKRSRLHDFFPLAIFEDDQDEKALPGIPFSPDILTKKIAAGKRVKELVVRFCNDQDRQKFRAFYNLCFSNS